MILLLGLRFLIGDQLGNYSEKVVHVTLDLLVAEETERVQSDVLVERLQGEVQDTLKDRVLEVEGRLMEKGVGDLLFLG